MQKQPLVVITGASQGIGRALSLAFVKEGNPLLLISRNIEPLKELEKYKDVIYAKVDVSDFNTLQNVVRQAEAKFGTAGCLINNAGFIRIGNLEGLDIGVCSYEIDVLFKGVVNGIKAVLDGMKKNKYGTIINISSIGDRKPGPSGEIYHASKAAVRSLTESLQQAEAKYNIRVINVAPGFIKTDIHKQMGISFEEYCRLTGYPDFISPEELAEVVMFCWKQPQKVCIRDIVVMPTNSGF